MAGRDLAAKALHPVHTCGEFGERGHLWLGVFGGRGL